MKKIKKLRLLQKKLNNQIEVFAFKNKNFFQKAK